MKVIIIAAYGKNREIGLEGKLPWNIPREYQHYQQTVRGHYLIMGRKNYLGSENEVQIGTPLILTRDQRFQPEKGASAFTSTDSLWAFLKNQKPEKVFVIGGEQIYRLFIEKNWVDQMILSEVDYDGAADTYFPEFDLSQWKIFKKQEFPSYRVTYYQRL